MQVWEVVVMVVVMCRCGRLGWCGNGGGGGGGGFYLVRGGKREDL